MTIKSGDTKAAILLVANVLTKEHQFSQTKAAEKATDIVKRAKAEKPDFDGKFLTEFLEKEMTKSVKAKPETKKESLTPAQEKVAKENLTTNEKIRQMIQLTPKGHRILKSLICQAIGCSFQRVTNVQKSMLAKAATGDQPKKEVAKPATKPGRQKAAKPATKTTSRRKASVPARETTRRKRSQKV